MSKHPLLRIPSIAWGIIYLLLIPLYALAYWSLHADFYHSTTRYEPDLESDERHILAELRKSMIANFVRFHGATGPPEGHDYANWDQLDLYDLRYEGEMFTFALSTRDSARDEMSLGAFRLSFTLLWGFPLDQESDSYILTPASSTGNYTTLIHTLFPPVRHHPKGIPRDNVGYIVISHGLRQRLQDWSRGITGFPSRNSQGSLARMVYLSAITITTVGYGDILPLTRRARLLVASEAVFGVVLIGLFLTALGHEVAGRADARAAQTVASEMERRPTPGLKRTPDGAA